MNCCQAHSRQSFQFTLVGAVVISCFGEGYDGVLHGIVLTDASNAAVVVFAELNCQLNDNPNADGDQADGSDVGHHLFSQ